ncbi:Fe(2+) transporter FeoB [subsurface metagenome]
MLQSIEKQIDDRNVLKNYPTNWLAFKVLEGDEKILTELEREFNLSNVRKKIEHFKETENYIPSSEISKRKYRAIKQILSKSVHGLSSFKEKRSDKADKIVLHRFWGYPILILIYAVFFLITFYLSSPIITGMDWLVSKFASWIFSLLLSANSPAFLNSLIVDGVIAGIGAVLLFLPIIAIFYTLVAILEDSGYLARSAYLMDRVMGKFGLQGTAFLSLIMGFGCNVAGIMATRTIKNENERKIMILANSFIPCAARLGVLAFITGIFFKPWLAAIILLLLYGLSIFLVLITAFLASFFRKTEEKLPLILELPEYRRPRFRNIGYLTFERTRIFIKKAGTMIFIASILIWLVSNIPFNADMDKTIIGYTGRGIAYVTYPMMGLEWKMVIPLVFGIGAKEVIISALGILYSSGGTIVSSLLAAWTIPQAIAFLVFQMTYAPCFATIASMKSESKSWKITALGFFYPLILTTIITTIVYHLFVLFMG